MSQLVDRLEEMDYILDGDARDLIRSVVPKAYEADRLTLQDAIKVRIVLSVVVVVHTRQEEALSCYKFDSFLFTLCLVMLNLIHGTGGINPDLSIAYPSQESKFYFATIQDQ